MQLDLFRDHTKKGLGTTDLFQVIPVGKKGDKQRLAINGGTMTFEWGGNIRDNEIKTAVLLLSMTLQSMGIDKIEKLRAGAQLRAEDENGQPAYSSGITVNAADMSELMFAGDRKKGKRVFSYLENLENLKIEYNLPGYSAVIRLFNRVTYKKGEISFDVANFLINRLATTLLAFRLPPILQNSGLAMRLALFIETRQSGRGTWKDAEGNIHTKYYPKNEYSLSDIVISLKLQATYNSNSLIAIKRISEAFIEIKNNNNDFPLFTYEPRRRVFENEYKNGLKNRSMKKA